MRFCSLRNPGGPLKVDLAVFSVGEYISASSRRNTASVGNWSDLGHGHLPCSWLEHPSKASLAQVGHQPLDSMTEMPLFWRRNKWAQFGGRTW